VILEGADQNLVLVAEAVREGPPEEVQALLFESLLLVHPIKSSDEECFDAGIGVESSVCGRVPEGINKPPVSRDEVEFLLEKLVTLHQISPNILISGTGLIIGRPAAVEELPAALADPLPEVGLSLLILMVPPHPEILQLRISELDVRLQTHLLNDRVEDLVDVRVLLVLVGAQEVLLDRLKPPEVVVAMGHHVYV